MNTRLPRLIPHPTPPQLALLLLALFTAAQFAALLREAPTVDEPAHLARGYTVLRTGDFRLHIGHPPLIGIWAALPLLFDPAIQLPLTDPTWQRADWIEFPITFFWKTANPALAMFRAGRIMIVLLGVLLGAVLYRLAADLGGPWLGLAALALYGLDPNLRAHARLITTDLGVTLGLTACLWLSWRLLRQPTWRLALAAGGVLGLTLASKYTALSVVPALGLVLLWSLRRRPWLVVAYGLSAGFVVWAIYGFQIKPAFGLPTPIPLADYFEELHFALTGIAGTHTYLLGQTSRTGSYAYFFVALLVKLPLPLMLLALAGSASLGGWRYPARGVVRALAVVVFPLALYLALTVLARINIGYRHIAPVWPLIYLGGALGLTALARHGLGRWLAVLAVGWLVFNTLRIYPRDLTFFNELAGGPRNGSRYLVDSNLDWGQDLDELIAYVHDHNLGPIHLSYFGPVPLAAIPVAGYDLQTLPLPPVPTPDWRPYHPAPGWYAISVTHLLGGAVLDDPDTFAYFRHRAPEAIIGNTIYVYHLPPESGTVAICTNPPPALAEAEARRAFGESAARLVLYDCAAGLPLPAGLTWYVFRGEQVTANQTALARLGAELIYDEPHRTDPRFAFSVYRLADAAQHAVRYPSVSVTPQTFGGRATLLGQHSPATLVPGGAAQIETVWEIASIITEPVSIFLHLTAPDGFVLEGSDGFNADYTALRPGDGLIQFHSFTAVNADAHLEVGVYALTLPQPRFVLPSGLDFLHLPITNN